MKPGWSPTLALWGLCILAGAFLIFESCVFLMSIVAN